MPGRYHQDGVGLATTLRGMLGRALPGAAGRISTEVRTFPNVGVAGVPCPIDGGRHAGATGGATTNYDAQLLEPLILQRNTLAAGLTRQTGKYEVLAAHGAIAGVCLDWGCATAAAVDLTASSAILLCRAAQRSR